MPGSSSEESALLADLRILRSAADRYAIEHDGNFPTSLIALARYTSKTGGISGNKTAVHKYGFYVREIPRCPTGPNRGATGWAAAKADPPTVVSGSPTVGWLYHAARGGVWVNDINHLDK
jgi:hypothetical protein